MNYSSTNLDVLRSLAVSLVVISHLLLDRSIVNPGGYDTHTLGTLGVLIFFVHTCLVLMHSLDRHAGAEGRSGMAVSFLLTRAWRIYPLSIVVVLVLSVIESTHSPVKPSLSMLLSNILLLQNITGSVSITPVLWSLPFEVQMYFLLPVLYRSSISWGVYSSFFIGGLWCASIALIYVFWLFELNFSLIKFLPCFLPGILAFCQRELPRMHSPIVLFAYVGAMSIVYPALVGREINATVLSWIICLFLGLLIPRCQEIQSTTLAACGRVIARYSYGIYLIHDPVRYLSFHYIKGISTFTAWSIFICALSGLSYLAYHLVEKPALEYGRALISRLNLGRLHAERSL